MKKTLVVNFGLVLAMVIGFSPSLMVAEPHNANASRRPLIPDFVDAERIYDNFTTFLKGVAADKKLNVATGTEAAEQFELAKGDIDKMVKAVESIKSYHKKVERFCTEDIEKFSSELMATFLSKFVAAAQTSVDGDEKKVSIKKEDVEAYAKLISQYIGKKATKFSDKKGEFEKEDKELLDSVKELAALFKVDVSNPDAFRTADRKFGYGLDALERIEKDKKACYFKDEPAATQPPAKQDPAKKNEPAKENPAAKVDGKDKGGPLVDAAQVREEEAPGKKVDEGKKDQVTQTQPPAKGLDLASLGQLMQKLIGDKINDLNKDFENALLANQRKNDDLLKAQQDQQRLNDELARALKDAENNDKGLAELAKGLANQKAKNGKDAPPQAAPSSSPAPSASIAPPTGSSNIPPPPQPPPPPPVPPYTPMAAAAPPPQDPVIETKKEDLFAQFNNRPRPVTPPVDPRTAGLLELARMQQQILFGPFGQMAGGMAGALNGRPGGGTTVANAVRGVGGGSVVGRTGVRPGIPGAPGGQFANGATPRSSVLPAALSQARM